MLNSKKILTVVRKLQPQLPALLGEKATEVQQQISPLIDQLAAGQNDGADLLKVLRTYPALSDILQQRLGLQQQIDDELLCDRSFQNLPGTPASAIVGQRYICPVPDCSEEWFQMRVGQSRLCKEHGAVMVLAQDEG